MERDQIWAEMAKSIGDIAEEAVEWEEEWLPERQQEEDGPPGAWKVTFTVHLPSGMKLGAYMVASPALLERTRASQPPGPFRVIARQFGDAMRLQLHKDTRMDEMRAELMQLAPVEPVP